MQCETLVALVSDEPYYEDDSKKYSICGLYLGFKGGPSSFQGHSATQYWQPGTSSQHDSYYSFGRVPSHMGWQNSPLLRTHDDVAAIFDRLFESWKKGTVS
ncbi:hypothetical protein Tco_0927773 [Tanacetum coccineum]